MGGLQRHPDRIDDWGLSSGFNIMRPDDAVWLYAAGRQYIYALARSTQTFADAGDYWSVDLKWDIAASRALERNPIPRASFGQVPQNVCRANRQTQAVLDQWLRARDSRLTRRDDPEGPASEEDARRWVLADIVRRQGQKGFRDGLLKAYGHRCAISGETAAEVLEAAHISPYRGIHTNSLENGLLLRSDLHTLFDLHRLGIDSSNRVVISPQVVSPTYASLQGTAVSRPRPVSARPGKRLLAAHLRLLRT